MLGQIYGDGYPKSSGAANIAAISFAGTVVGQLVFGYTSDKWSRRNSLLVATVIMIIFTALSAGSYGGGSLSGMIAALTAYRGICECGYHTNSSSELVLAGSTPLEVSQPPRHRAN